jgi:hypothetical protein
MKCNQCKNPVEEIDAICEWCGAELILFSSQDENHPIYKLQNDLMAIEVSLREKMQLKLDRHNNNSSTIDKFFGKKPSFDWDEDLEEQLAIRVCKLQSKLINNLVLPNNPKVLKELAEVASENYKISKPNIWNSDSEDLQESKQLLSDSWYSLMNRSKNRLGIKDQRKIITKIINYIGRKPNLKILFLIILFYLFFFTVIGLINYFSN